MQVNIVKRSLTTLAALLFLSHASSGFADDGNSLLRGCNDFIDMATNNRLVNPSNEMAAGSCVGMMRGITTLNRVYQTMEGRDLFCLPLDGIEFGQAARVVIKYMEDHPEKLHQDEALIAIIAFKEAFPCKAPTIKELLRDAPVEQQ